MDSDEILTQCTQNIMDPRRLGRQNSGLSAEDVSDVMCILHPGTPAAFQLVADTARRTPQHILQRVSTPKIGFPDSPGMVEEQETFILDNTGANVALDLAFRFSSNLVSPHLGFTFGRNMNLCDIAPSADAHKRVSNLHFAIYLNESGVLMIKDLSTNGTMVDEVLLKGKTSAHPVQRMLNNGSIVQILTERPSEALKFIVRIPNRGEYEKEYKRKCGDWIDRKFDAEVREREKDEKDLDPEDRQVQRRSRPDHRYADATTQLRVPIIQNAFGMHWDGGHKYNVVGQIGKGAFASVYQLATKSHGRLFAAKELEKRKFMKNGVLDRKLENEMLIMRDIDHPSIVQYHEYQDAAHHLYIIMEFVENGDLQQYLSLYGPLAEGMAKQMAAQVFDALDYLHKKRVTHRDIKPDNILLASIEPNNFVIKLSDFGLSKVVKDNETFLKTFCGTLLYCAPEVFPHYDAHVTSKGTKRPRQPPPPQALNKFHSYSQAVDIWSFGAVLWYSLCQKPPFEGVSDTTGRGMFDKIMMTPLDTRDLQERKVSEQAVALLMEMLNTDPASRPSAETCLKHIWLGGAPRPVRRQPDLALEAIVEELEGDYEMVPPPDVGALSLDERRQQGSYYSEVSLDSDDLNFFDPRKSKRFKADEVEDDVEDDDGLIDSSPELFEGIEHRPHENAATSKPPKLFGEISQSDLQTSAFARLANAAIGHARDSIESDMQFDAGQDSRQQVLRRPSGSLQGAEQLVRDMNVDSPHCGNSDAGSGYKAATPPHPTRSHGTTTQGMTEGRLEGHPVTSDDPDYKRNITIMLPPSFYFDADNPETHNLEHASKISGRDFAAHPAYSLKDTSTGALSETSSNSQNSITEKSQDNAVRDATATSFRDDKPSRPVYGRLIPTNDSVDYDLALHDSLTTFGRSSKSTYVWTDSSELQVGKNAMTIFFGLSNYSQSLESTSVEGQYCNIMTHSRNGLFINGIELKMDTPQLHSYGRIYTGDEILVCKELNNKKALKFVVQINQGPSKVRRPRHGPNAKFKVLHDSPVVSRRKKSAGSAAKAGFEKENEVVEL